MTPTVIVGRFWSTSSSLLLLVKVDKAVLVVAEAEPDVAFCAAPLRVGGDAVFAALLLILELWPVPYLVIPRVNRWAGVCWSSRFFGRFPRTAGRPSSFPCICLA